MQASTARGLMACVFVADRPLIDSGFGLVRGVGRRLGRPSTHEDCLRSTEGRSEVVVIHPSRVYVGGIRSIKHHTRDLGGGAVDGKQSVCLACGWASRAGLRPPDFSARQSLARLPSTDGTLDHGRLQVDH